jgi:hypothetical protein
MKTAQRTESPVPDRGYWIITWPATVPLQSPQARSTLLTRNLAPRGRDGDERGGIAA